MRECTDTLIQAAEDGLITWKTLTMSCLVYMSEHDVRDMADTDFRGLTDDKGDDNDE